MKGFRTDLLFEEGRARQRRHAVKAGKLSRLSPRAHRLTDADRRKPKRKQGCE